MGLWGVAWVVSGLVSVGLVPMPPWLWVVARCVVVVEVICLVAGGILMAMRLSRRFREWVESGVRRCGGWIRGLF